MQQLFWYDVTKLLCIVTVLILCHSNVLHCVALLIYHSTVCVLRLCSYAVTILHSVLDSVDAGLCTPVRTGGHSSGADLRTP